LKKVIIIAGPNGAGKTTFAEEFLPGEAGCAEFVNADLIAAGLSPFRPGGVALAAGRLMLARMAVLAAAGRSFAFETTLASRVYFRRVARWRAAGYLVKLCFLKLPDPGFAIRRVEQRVRLGGHGVPSATVRRRFWRGLANLEEGYLEVVDEWAIYDASRYPVELTATGDNRPPDRLMESPDTAGSRPATQRRVQPLDDPDFTGAEAALERAATKAIARARAAGLEPVLAEPRDPGEEGTEPGREGS
jgi:predicted ABC-type ATPase